MNNTRIKNLIPYFLILIILVGIGFFGLKKEAEAAAGCWYMGSNPPVYLGTMAQEQCKDGIDGRKNVKWLAEPPPGGLQGAAAPRDEKKNTEALWNELPGCYIANLDACIVLGIYFLFYSIPSFILPVVGKLLNIVIALALDGEIYNMKFIANTWAIVRDFSNIFFILVLLYIAVKTILGIGASDTKKMIVNVVIMALLINFSMFFTKVVIDSSNILALIFYNKINVVTSVDGKPRPDLQLVENEKDFSGAIISKFDPTLVLSEEFFNNIRNSGLIKTTSWSGKGLAAYMAAGAGASAWAGPGALIGAGIGALVYGVSAVFSSGQIPLGLLTGIIVTSGLIMMFAIYAFFVAALSFIGRMIELWLLIIFSPFAFMSYAVPHLDGVEYISWKSWSTKLISTSFMAPIFMFFMFFIFQVLKSNLWIDLTRHGEKSPFEIVLLIILPALLILILLLKAASFAKKGSGAIGDMVFKTAGFAMGAVVGGTAMLATKTIGVGASMLASNKGLNKAQDEKGWRGMAARATLKTADYSRGASFDLRKAPGIGSIAKSAGLNLESASAIGLGAKTGGYQQRREEQIKKRQERAKSLEVREDETLTQELRTAESQLQTILHDISGDLHVFDENIKEARQELDDAYKSGDKGKQEKATEKLEEAQGKKRELKTKEYTFKVNGKDVTTTAATLEKKTIPHAKIDIEKENRERKRGFADRIEGKTGIMSLPIINKINQYRVTDKEAAYKIRMEAKISGGSGKDHGGGGHSSAPAPKTPAPSPTPVVTGGSNSGGEHN